MLGGASEIGANCYYIEYNNKSILLDCGAHPSKEGFNQFVNLDNISIEPEYVFISHAHNDHIGSLPFLIKKFPKINIIATEETIELSKVMLKDMQKIFNRTVNNGYKIDFHCLITNKNNCLPLSFNQSLKINDDLTVTYYRAGHILGAAMIYLEINGFNILYTGDFSLKKTYTVEGCDLNSLKNKKIDIIISEATYGNKNKSESFTMREKKLENIINENEGIILFPAYALGRTQELIQAIYKLKAEGFINSSIPVYIAGLGVKVNNKYKIYFDTEAWNYIEELDDTNKFDIDTESICIASSGMLRENTASYKIAQLIINDEKNKIIFPGYVGEEEIGYKLLSDKNFKIKDDNGQELETLATIDRIDFSAHSNSVEIINFISELNPNYVIFVHGYNIKNLVTKLKEKRTIKPIIPTKNGETLDIIKTDEQLYCFNSADSRLIIITVGDSIYSNYRRTKNSEAKDEQILLDFVNENPKKNSAELNTLLNIKDKILNDNTVIKLISSDSKDGTGYLSAKVLREYLNQFYENKVEIYEIKNLVKDAETFKEYGLINFVNTLVKLIKAHKETIILATGGYKATTAFSTILAATFKLPVYYMHEDFKSENPVIEIPYFPINYDFTEFHKFANLINELCDIENQKIAKSLFNKLPDSLKKIIVYSQNEDRYKLTPIGLLYKEAYEYWKNAFEKQLKNIIVLEKIPNLWKSNVVDDNLSIQDILVDNIRDIFIEIIKLNMVEYIAFRKINKINSKTNHILFTFRKGKANIVYCTLFYKEYEQKIIIFLKNKKYKENFLKKVNEEILPKMNKLN